VNRQRKTNLGLARLTGLRKVQTMPRLKDQTQRQDAAFFLNAAYLHLVSESLVHQRSTERAVLPLAWMLPCCWIAITLLGCSNQSIDSPSPSDSVSMASSDQETSKDSSSVALVAVNTAPTVVSGANVGDIDPKRAFSYLEKICKIGSRTTGTLGMQKQQEMLEEHFAALGGVVLWQPFESRHPVTGAKVEIKNLVVRWRPELAERVLLCTHYDTKPFPAMDSKNPKGLFVGANDGGSGTALFMELGHTMPNLSLQIGVDFVFFDAEELVYEENRDPYFLGSKYFAQAYVNDPSSARYRCGILLDMVGDADLQLYYEENSFKFARPLVEEVWGIAKQLGVKEFEPKLRHYIRDDHLPLNEIAKIPVIDIIDFDYPRGASKNRSYWHTMADTPDKCSGASLAKVGRVLVEWMKRQK
jgi:glutaminyl-peptide cyclotransferase